MTDINQAKPTNPALIISAMLSILGGLLTLQLWSMYSTVITWMQDPANPAPWITGYYFVANSVVPILAIGGGIFVLIKRSARLNLILAVAIWLVFNFLDLIFQALWLMWQGDLASFDFNTMISIVLPILSTTELYAFASLIFLLNPILAFVANSVSRKTPNAAAAAAMATSATQTANQGEQQMSNQQPTGYDPQTGAPLYGQPAQGQPTGYDPQTGAPIYQQAPQSWPKPESQLPLVSLILAFFFPLAGIIVGHIALGQMKRNEIPSSNEGMAKAGLILSYVFTAITVVIVFAWVAIFATMMNMDYYDY